MTRLSFTFESQSYKFLHMINIKRNLNHENTKQIIWITG
jgi:hypothetical protein